MNADDCTMRFTILLTTIPGDFVLVPRIGEAAVHVHVDRLTVQMGPCL